MKPAIIKKYDLLNALKIIAAFFVVCIHVHFPGDFGNAVIAVARFGVPFFFMVSGFFSYYEDKSSINAKYKRKIKHILVLLLSGILMYFLFGLAVAVVNGNVSGYFVKIFSFKSFFEFLVFNNTSVSEFLWFMPALIYTYIVFFVFEKTGITKKIYFLIPVLFLSGVVLREAAEFLPGFPEYLTNSFICRNFLFVGIPFFMLGHYIRANEEKVKEKFSLPLLIFLMIIGTAEAIYADVFRFQKSLYIGTFVAVFALFVFAIKYENNIKCKPVSDAGAKYSFYVYVIHIMLRNVFSSVGDLIPFAGKILDATEAVYPVVVFAAALVVSFIYVEIKTLLKNKKQKCEVKK